MAISFDGTSDFYMTQSSDGVPVSAYPISVFCWARIQSDVLAHAFSIADAAAGNDYLSLFHNVTDRDVFFRELAGGTTGQARTAGGGVTNDVWTTYVGLAISATDRKSYHSGGNEGTNATDLTAFPTSLDRFGIGCAAHSSPTSNEWNGDIDWCAMWDAELTTRQIDDLNNGYSPLTVQRQSLVHFSRCAYINPIDMIGGRQFTDVTGTPSNATGPDGLRRVLPRARGRSRLRVSA